jgi:acetyl-CoA acetyltransferase
MSERKTVAGVAAITGVGYAPFSSHSGRTVLDQATEAVANAAHDAGLEQHDIDALLCFHENDTALTREVAAALGLPRVNWWNDVLAGGNYPCAMIGLAAMVVASGMARNVACYRALNGRSGVRMGHFRGDDPGGVRQFMLPYGFGTPPQVFAMACRRHMHEFGTTRLQTGKVAITTRHHAALNERATKRSELSMDEYLGARMIADPLHLYDCCQETDGACAVIVSGKDRAADLRHPVVTVASVTYSAGYMGRYPFDRWPDMTHGCLMEQRETLFGLAGIGPADIDVAELYDAFSFEVIMQLEELGFCGRGEGGGYVDQVGIGLESRMPVNTHGGLLSEGYMQGLGHVCEAVLQLRRACGDRQVPNPRTALVTSFGFGSGSALILMRD